MTRQTISDPTLSITPEKKQSASFQIKLKELISECKYSWFEIDEKVLASEMWHELKFGCEQAHLVIEKLILLCKLTRILEENNEFANKKMNISYDWQLYLLAGGKLPLSIDLNSKLATFLLAMQKACLTETDQYGRNALYYAALGGCVETLRYLLQEDNLGKVKEKVDQLKVTFVPYTIVTGLFLQIKSTLSAELFRIEFACGLKKLDPFFASLFSQDSAVVSEIIAINKVYHSSETERSLFKILKDQCGRTAIHYAAIAGNIRIIPEKCLTQDDLATPSKSGYTPLHYAIYYNNKEAIEDLVALNPKLLWNSATVNRVNPLFFAVEQEADAKLVDHLLLVDKEKNFHRALLTQYYFGNILTYLASANKFSLFRHLFAVAGAILDINYQVKDQESFTVLASAIQHNNITAIGKIIKDYQVDPYRKQEFRLGYYLKEKLNAFQIAAAIASPDILRILIEHYKVSLDFCGKDKDNLFKLSIMEFENGADAKKQNVKATIELMIVSDADPLLAPGSIQRSAVLTPFIDKIWMRDLAAIIYMMMDFNLPKPILDLIVHYLFESMLFKPTDQEWAWFEKLKTTVLSLRSTVRKPLLELATLSDDVICLPDDAMRARQLYQNTTPMDLINLYTTLVTVQTAEITQHKTDKKFFAAVQDCLEQYEKQLTELIGNIKYSNSPTKTVSCDGVEQKITSKGLIPAKLETSLFGASKQTLFSSIASDIKVVPMQASLSVKMRNLQESRLLAEKIKKLDPETDWKTLIHSKTSEAVLLGAYKTAFVAYFITQASVSDKEDPVNLRAAYVLGYIIVQLTERKQLQFAQESLAIDITMGNIAEIRIDTTQIYELIQMHHQEALLQYSKNMASSFKCA